MVVVQGWSVFGGFLIQIGIKISSAGLSLTVVDWWPLFRGYVVVDIWSKLTGGCYYQKAVINR